MILLEDRRYIIYKAISPSKRVYIGLTSMTLNKRKSAHYRQADASKKKTRFQRALVKYKNEILWEIIDQNLTREEAIKLERFWIDKYESILPKNGYNSTSGGEGTTGFYFDEETKRKMSKMAKKRFKDDKKYRDHCLGQKKRYKNEEQRLLSKIKSKIFWKDENNRKKQSEKRKQYFLKKENRNKSSIEKGGKLFFVFNSNEELVGSWYNIKLCAEELSLTPTLIRDCLLGKQKTHKNYYFNYKNILPNRSRKQFLRCSLFGIFHNGFLLETFNSQNKCAKKYNLDQHKISLCLNKYRNSCKGFNFEYLYSVEVSPKMVDN